MKKQLLGWVISSQDGAVSPFWSKCFEVTESPACFQEILWRMLFWWSVFSRDWKPNCTPHRFEAKCGEKIPENALHTMQLGMVVASKFNSIDFDHFESRWFRLVRYLAEVRGNDLGTIVTPILCINLSLTSLTVPCKGAWCSGSSRTFAPCCAPYVLTKALQLLVLVHRHLAPCPGMRWFPWKHFLFFSQTFWLCMQTLTCTQSTIYDEFLLHTVRYCHRQCQMFCSIGKKQAWNFSTIWTRKYLPYLIFTQILHELEVLTNDCNNRTVYLWEGYGMFWDAWHLSLVSRKEPRSCSKFNDFVPGMSRLLNLNSPWDLPLISMAKLRKSTIFTEKTSSFWKVKIPAAPRMSTASYRARRGDGSFVTFVIDLEGSKTWNVMSQKSNHRAIYFSNMSLAEIFPPCSPAVLKREEDEVQSGEQFHDFFLTKLAGILAAAS